MSIVGALSFIGMNRYLGHGDGHDDHHPHDDGHGTHVQLEEIGGDIIDEPTPCGEAYPPPQSDVMSGLEAPQSPSSGYKVVDTTAVTLSLDDADEDMPPRPRSNSCDSERGEDIREILEVATKVNTPRHTISNRLKSTGSLLHQRKPAHRLRSGSNQSDPDSFFDNLFVHDGLRVVTRSGRTRLTHC